MKLLLAIKAHHIGSLISAACAPFLMNYCLNQVGDMREVPVACLIVFQVAIAVIITVVSIRDNTRPDISLPDKLSIQVLFWACGIIPLLWTGLWLLRMLSILDSQ